MQNSHLVVILRTFSRKELRELRKWLESPVHSQREDVILLLDYLSTGDRLNSEKYLNKEKIFARLFPSEPFDDAKMRQSIHFLLKSVEEFLIFQELQLNPVRLKIALASNFRKRKLDKSFQKAIRQVEEMQEQYHYRNNQYLKNEFLLQLEKSAALVEKKRTAEMNLQEVSDTLEAAFLADKLRQSCRMLEHQAVYKAQYRLGMLEEVIRYVESENFLEIPAIAVYYYIYKSITDKNNPAHFEQLKSQIHQNGHFFPAREIRDIFLSAINYCIIKINAGEEKFVREAFELYRQGFDKDILADNNVLTRFTFLNVFRIAMRLKEFTWANRFIPKYSPFLEEEHRDTIVHYTKARLHFEKKEYDTAMRLLIHADFDDYFLQLSAKTMLSKMYYELGEFDALESLLDSMRIYIKRKQIDGFYKTNYQNIIQYTKKLIRVNPYNREHKDKLRQEIQAATPLNEKEWLLEQLEAL